MCRPYHINYSRRGFPLKISVFLFSPSLSAAAVVVTKPFLFPPRYTSVLRAANYTLVAVVAWCLMQLEGSGDYIVYYSLRVCMCVCVSMCVWCVCDILPTSGVNVYITHMLCYIPWSCRKISSITEKYVPYINNALLFIISSCGYARSCLFSTDICCEYFTLIHILRHCSRHMSWFTRGINYITIIHIGSCVPVYV